MVTKARSWLIAAFATAAMLVVILAVGNPAVTRTILDHNVNGHGFGSRALQSFTNFGWNVTKLGNDPGRFYLAGVLFDIAVLVLVFLLVAAVTIGRGSFLQVFMGTWVSVIAAMMVAGYVRPAVIESRFLGTTGTSKAETVFFSSFSPSPLLLFVAIVTGVVVALVAAAGGVATRRREALGMPPPPPSSGTPTDELAAPPSRPQLVKREPWPAPPASGPSNRPPWAAQPADESDRTTQLPAAPGASDQSDSSSSEHTMQMRPVEDGPAEPR